MDISTLIRYGLCFVMLFSQAACSNPEYQGLSNMQIKAPTKPSPIVIEDHCAFNTTTFPIDISVFAAGAYSGRKLDFQIDTSGHQATQMDVVVNHSQNPIVLMLGAYEPTIWNVSWTSESKIIAVMLSGYHKQVITGLTKETPVLISTDENKGKCGVFYVDTDRLSSLNPIARRLFKHEVDMVYLAENGQILIGKALSEQTQLMQSPLTKPEQYRQEELSGIPGLEQAVSSGILRKATLEDANAWVDTISKELPQKDIPPVAGQGVINPKRPLLLNAYVVLKPFTYPDGLFGGNSAVFFIPKGIAKPNGNQGHSTVYDFNTLSCLGSLCNRSGF